MNKSQIKTIFQLLGIFVLLEGLSILSFTFPGLNQIFFYILAALALIISCYKIEYGLWLVLAELIIGSKGYLFYLSIGDSNLLSIRLVIWTIFMLVFAGQFIRQVIKSGTKSKYYQAIKNFIFLKQYFVLAIFIALGLISAFIYGNNLNSILLDFNAWLYFLLLFPIITIDFKKEDIINIFIAGSVWISIKTLLLLAVFSNNLNFAPEIYSWLRKTLVGEMTNASGWKRVFIQSQIFSVISYFFLLFKISPTFKFKNFFRLNNLLLFFLGGLFLSTLLISLSRSFWVGFAFTVTFGLILIFKIYGLQRAVLALSWLLATTLLSLILIFAATPFLTGGLQNQIVNRLGNSEEAALVSRWTLLPEIIKEIKVNPISGQGFGADLTYISSDPRILEREPSGRYTTYAFEWGYLDMWLKTGILGLLAYFWLLFTIIKSGLINGTSTKNYLYLGLTAGVIFLTIVHIFTPYLNHPLGIGFIILSSCLIQKDRVY